MTVEEFQKLIAQSEHNNYYQSLTLTLNFDHLNYTNEIKGVVSIHQFLSDQVDGFKQMGTVPLDFAKSASVFKNSLERMERLCNSKNIQGNQWNDVLEQIRNNAPRKFLYNVPATLFLYRLYQINGEYYSGAHKVIVGDLSQPSKKGQLIGHHLASSFLASDISVEGLRKDSEMQSVDTLAKNFQVIVDTMQKQSVDFIKFITKEQERIAAESVSITKEKEKVFNELFTVANNNLSAFHTASTNKMVELEKLYSDKLKLAAPAQYWSKRAAQLRKEGRIWLISLIVCVVVAISALIVTLIRFSNGYLVEIFAESGTAIKWSVLFVTFISFLAYSIRIFSKLTFSSFHLVRDAEEREQLTYVYLALQKEKGIDQTERHLIMQSLFSRADSGLLKDDGSPTMPGIVADKLVQERS